MAMLRGIEIGKTPPMVQSLQFRRSADCIIGTPGPPERIAPVPLHIQSALELYGVGACFAALPWLAVANFAICRGGSALPRSYLLNRAAHACQNQRRWSFREAQRAGLDRLYPFHSLRHSAVTNVYRQTRDLFLAQRFARHASPLTTTVYTHPSDEKLANSLRSTWC